MKISYRFLLMAMFIVVAGVTTTIVGVLVADSVYEAIEIEFDAARRNILHVKQFSLLDFFATPRDSIFALQDAAKVPGTFNASDIHSFHQWFCLISLHTVTLSPYIGIETGESEWAAIQGLWDSPPILNMSTCLVGGTKASTPIEISHYYHFSPAGIPHFVKSFQSGTYSEVYDSRTRPWYNIGKKGPTWSEVYLDWSAQFTTFTFSAPAIDPNTDAVYGVWGIDFKTSVIISYLQNSKSLPSEHIALVERSTKNVVAVSWNESAVFFDKSELFNCGFYRNETCSELRVATLKDLVSPMIAGAVRSIGESYFYDCRDEEHSTENMTVCQTSYGSRRDKVMVDVASLRDNYNLDLRLIMMVREADRLEPFWDRVDVLLAVVTIVGVALVAVSTFIFHVLLGRLDNLDAELNSTLYLYSSEQPSPHITSEVGSINTRHRELMENIAIISTYLSHRFFVDPKDQHHLPPPQASISQSSATSFSQAESYDGHHRSSTTPKDSLPPVSTACLQIQHADEALVNQFHTTKAAMIVVHLTSRAATGNLDAFSAETAAFMDATIPHILHARGVIELQRPTQIVATFESSDHVGRAGHCGLRIGRSARRHHLLATTVVHSGSFVTGACGSQGRNAFVVASDFMERGVKLAELSQRCLRCPVIGTDAVAKQLPPSLVSVPVDHVTGLQASEEGGSVIFEITKATGSETEAAACELTKEVFTLMLNGEYERAASKAECAPASLVLQHTTRLGKLAALAVSNGIQTGYLRRHLNWDYINTVECPYNDSDSTAEPIAIVDGLPQHRSQTKQDHLLGASLSETSVRSTSTTGSIFNASASSLPTGSGHQATEGLTKNQIAQYSQLSEFLDDEVPVRFLDVRKTVWFRPPGAVKLGKRAFSTVYEGMNAQGSVVELKCMRSYTDSLKDDRDVVVGVTRVSKMSHPNVAALISLAIQPSLVIFIQERMSTGSLRTVIENYKELLPRSASKRFAIDVIQGLQYLHKHNVVHGDLKPENVMLGADSVCKLTDYGSVLERRITGFSGTMEELESMDLHGTVPYMAPEVARGGLPTTASDIWSFGVLLHELITGELPWEHENGPAGAARDQRKMIRGLACDAGDPGALRPRMAVVTDSDLFTAEGWKLAKACLDENPANRPHAERLLEDSFFR